MSLTKSLLVVITGCLTLLCVVSWAQEHKQPNSQGHSYILWVQEVHGQALYWVNDKPWGRRPLTGLVSEKDFKETSPLVVIIDSKVPIQEIAEIESLMGQLGASSVSYYAFNRDYSKGMSEIVWKDHAIPLPGPPPPLVKP